MMELGTARRRFFCLVGLTLALPGLLVWGVFLRDWWLVVMGLIALPPMIGRLVDAFSLAWPGSRSGWCGSSRRLHLSKAQGIVVGFGLFIPMVALLAILDGGLNAVAFGAAAVVCALWLFWLVRVMQAEGWRGGKRSRK